MDTAIKSKKLGIYDALCEDEPSLLPHSVDKCWAMYWEALRAYMRGNLTKAELDTAVLGTIGDRHVHRHNDLILAMLHNATSVQQQQQQPAKASAGVGSELQVEGRLRRRREEPSAMDEDDQEVDADEGGGRKSACCCRSSKRPYGSTALPFVRGRFRSPSSKRRKGPPRSTAVALRGNGPEKP